MAYTFIYTIVSIAIFSSILLIMKYGKNTVDEYKNSKEVRNAFINIYLVSSDNGIKNIEVSGKEILLEGESFGKEILNIIKLKNNVISVSYYEKKNGIFQLIKSNTPILKEVEGFDVIKRGEVLCIEIVRKGETFVKYI